MMYWHSNNPGGWVFALMIIGMVVFWCVLGAGFWLLVRSPTRTGLRRAPVLHTAERLLAERFARGEIDEAEYLDRLTTLHRAPTHTS